MKRATLLLAVMVFSMSAQAEENRSLNLKFRDPLTEMKLTHPRADQRALKALEQLEKCDEDRLGGIDSFRHRKNPSRTCTEADYINIKRDFGAANLAAAQDFRNRSLVQKLLRSIDSLREVNRAVATLENRASLEDLKEEKAELSSKVQRQCRLHKTSKSVADAHRKLAYALRMENFTEWFSSAIEIDPSEECTAGLNRLEVVQSKLDRETQRMLALGVFRSKKSALRDYNGTIQIPSAGIIGVPKAKGGE